MKAPWGGITAALLFWTIAKAFNALGALGVLGVLGILGVLVVLGARQAFDQNLSRKKQLDFNKKHKISPQSVQKEIREGIEELQEAEKLVINVAGETNQEHELNTIIAELEYEMEMAARNLQFEKAALIRDKINEIKTKGF